MNSAYNEAYLDDAMSNLGEALDYAVYACGVSMDEFMALFVLSGYAKQFSCGNAKVISGLSGSELCLCVLESSGKSFKYDKSVRIDYSCSPEYWCGYILAYFQWYSSMSFKEILKYISMSDVLRMYITLHEAPEDKAVDVFYSVIKRKNMPAKLQLIRKNSKMSQRELAERSGVSLRSIQQYEQRAKDINKAAADTLMSLSSVLGCKIEDIME